MADCIHLWEVTGTDNPIVRCGKCNLKWYGLHPHHSNPEAFDILQDAVMRYVDTLHTEDLEKARAIWDWWTRPVPSSAHIRTVVEDHFPVIEVDRGWVSVGGRVIFCSCGFRFADSDDRVMGINFAQHLADRLSK